MLHVYAHGVTALCTLPSRYGNAKLPGDLGKIAPACSDIAVVGSARDHFQIGESWITRVRNLVLDASASRRWLYLRSNFSKCITAMLFSGNRSGSRHRSAGGVDGAHWQSRQAQNAATRGRRAIISAAIRTTATAIIQFRPFSLEPLEPCFPRLRNFCGTSGFPWSSV